MIENTLILCQFGVTDPIPGSGIEIKNLDPGSGMENPDPGSGIRDKNHRSATLVNSKVRKKHIQTSYSIQLSISFRY